MALTQKQKEKMALLIASGKNTYIDLHQAFPNFDNNTWYNLIGDHFKPKANAMIRVPIPNFFLNKYLFFLKIAPTIILMNINSKTRMYLN